MANVSQHEIYSTYTKLGYTKKQIDDAESEEVDVSISDQTVITAGDFGKFISNFQILNPDLVICNLTKNVTLDFKINIKKGRGFVVSEEN